MNEIRFSVLKSLDIPITTRYQVIFIWLASKIREKETSLENTSGEQRFSHRLTNLIQDFVQMCTYPLNVSLRNSGT